MPPSSAALAPSTAASRAPAGKANARPAARACSEGRAPSPWSPRRLRPIAVILAAATMNLAWVDWTTAHWPMN
eukprot:1188903-Alexandrium_andersonii.AAC.1